MARYSVTGIPNTPEAREACARIRTDLVRLDKKGRGHRHGQVRYHVSLPLPKAERFTLYVNPKARERWEEYERFECVGIRNGKLVIRRAA